MAAERRLDGYDVWWWGERAVAILGVDLDD